MIDFTKYDHCISTMPLFQGLSLTEIQFIQSDITEQAFLQDSLSIKQKIYLNLFILFKKEK